jgi:(p)ppGpp synthase/HD superfamily hydrolase
MNRDFTRINDACMYAGLAHASIGQVRKYSKESYIVHPMRVCRLLDEVGETDDVLIGALLHDVVEDTPITLAEIQAKFGMEIAKYVEGMTDVSKPEDGNRAVRKTIDREHSWEACGESQTIKCADLIDNTEDITSHDKDFSQVYLREKRLLLPGLTKANPALIQKAWETLEAAEIKIFGIIQGERT